MESSILCEQCAEIGKSAPADYFYRSEEMSLAGPLLGDPDARPPEVTGRHFLCHEHYAHLPADSRLDYVPSGDDKDHLRRLGEMGRTTT